MKIRSERINEEMRRELAAIIKNMKDPRIPLMTSVVRVDATRDLKYAKAYISVMGDAGKQQATIAHLKSAAAFIRRELGNKLELRFIPEIIFVLDKSIEYGAHINKIIKELNNEKDN